MPHTNMAEAGKTTNLDKSNISSGESLTKDEVELLRANLRRKLQEMLIETPEFNRALAQDFFWGALRKSVPADSPQIITFEKNNKTYSVDIRSSYRSNNIYFTGHNDKISLEMINSGFYYSQPGLSLRNSKQAADKIREFIGSFNSPTPSTQGQAK